MSASTRFCPYCGQTNDSAFTFCARCGKPLPLLGPAPPPALSGVPLPPPPPAPPEVDLFETVYDRPLTEHELESLKRAKRSPAVGATKVLATLFGVAPPLLIFLSFNGVPFDPTALPGVLIGSAVIAVIAGAACRLKRYPAEMTLAKGTVREARGVPKMATRPSHQTAIQIGDVEFTANAAASSFVQQGRMNSVVYLPPNNPIPGRPVSKRAYILSVNGLMPKSPLACIVNDVAAPQGLPPPPPPPAYAQGVR